MLLYVLVCNLIIVEGYSRAYKGFDDCGYNGWTCNVDGSSHDITYQCSKTADKNARLWAWTARIPSTATSITIRDCNHVELHLDCTVGLRNYAMKQVRIINVTLLEFLRPLRPRIFLHDNDEVPQSPVRLYLEDIGSTSFYSGMFVKPGGRCTYKSEVLKEIEFKNVNIDKIDEGSFNNTGLEKFWWTNVKASNIEVNSVQVELKSNSVQILNSTLNNITKDSFQFAAPEVTLENNTIKSIPTTSFKVKSQIFTLKGNFIDQIEKEALEVFSTETHILNNTIQKVETGAWQKISPGLWSFNMKKLSKFLYIFDSNKINEMQDGSLHMDVDGYLDVCSKVELTNNEFSCSCSTMGWTSLVSQLGFMMKKFQFLYEKVIHGNNTCNDGCSVHVFSSNVQSLCSGNITQQQACTTQSTSSPTTMKVTTKEISTISTTAKPIVRETIIQTAALSPETKLLQQHELITTTSGVPVYVWVIIFTVLICLFAGIGYFGYKSYKSHWQNRQVHVKRMTDESGEDDLQAVLY